MKSRRVSFDCLLNAEMPKCPRACARTECKVISESEQGLVSFVADKGLIPGQPKWANYVKVGLVVLIAALNFAGLLRP